MRLPCLISVPHGGTLVPPEVEDLIVLSPEEILRDGDPFTPELYDLPAVRTVRTEIARAVVDVNRAPDDLPPANPDGVIKSHTCFGREVYRELPSPVLVNQLLERYYFPYHRRLREALREGEILIAFDCHSMAPYPPPIAPDREKRPAICLGDYHGRACDRRVTETLALCFREAFGLKADEVLLNRPFVGGYITRRYGGDPIPWIQIEVRRDLYMDWDRLRTDRERLEETRERILKALSLFFERVSL